MSAPAAVQPGAGAFDRDVVVTLVVAAVVRVVFVFVVYAHVAGRFGSGDGYDDIARSLVAGQGYTIGGVSAAAERLPFYPLLLAASMAVFGPASWPWQLLQTACGAATCALVVSVARRYASRAGALAAGVFCALHPTLVLYAARPLTETIFIFLTTVMAAVLLRAPPRDAIAGVLLGCQVLTKSTALLHWLAWLPAALRGRWSRVARAAAAVVVVLIPWMTWKVASEPAAQLLTATSGRALYDGLYISRHAGWVTPAGDLNAAAELTLNDELRAHGVSPAVAIRERDRLAGGFARQWIVAHPLATTALMCRNLVLTWYLGRSRLSMLLHALLHGVLLVAAARGARRLWTTAPGGRDVVWICGALVLAYTALHAVVQPAVRYVLPAVPLAAVLAAAAVPPHWPRRSFPITQR